MKKVVIISRDQTLSWKSCQVISSNLGAAYQELFADDQVKIINYNDDLNLYQTFQMAEEISNYNPDIIIFTEHKPHPQKVIDFFMSTFKGEQLPEIYFHIYGDFILYAREWIDLAPKLENFKVKFLCASDAQASLVTKLIKDPIGQVFKCPFPVDTTFFQFDSKLRAETRNELGLKEEKAFLYTGRISYQKKIIELVNCFASFLLSSKIPAKLYLAGDFDDLGVPYLDYGTCRNSYYMRFHKYFKKLPLEISRNIIYLGNLEGNQLLKMYNAADTFVSLSVHNDEDYGMSPAEALICGLPSILTNWGGYASFHFPEIKQACTLIPTVFSETKIEVNDNIFIKQLLRSQLEDVSMEDRNSIANFYANKISIPAVKSELGKIMNSKAIKFSGFNELFEKLVSSPFKQKTIFMKMKKTYNQLYRDMYESYIS